MRRSVYLLAALVTIGLLSPACTTSTGTIKAGDCFQTGTAATFGWGTEVPCDQPHSVEVFAVRNVATTLGDYPRSALDEAGHPARQQYLALIKEFCEPEWSKYTGFNDLGSLLAPDAVILPAIYGDMALEATPAQEWHNGNQTVLCYQVFGRPGTGREEAIMVQSPVLAALGPAGASGPANVPIQLRDCATSQAGDHLEQRVSCARPHDREYLGHLDVAQFVGQVPGLDREFLDRFDSTTATPQDQAVLDGLCRQIFPPLLGGHRDDVTLLAQVHTDDQTWGWADNGSYHAACFATTGHQVVGSVVGINYRPPS